MQTTQSLVSELRKVLTQQPPAARDAGAVVGASDAAPTAADAVGAAAAGAAGPGAALPGAAAAVSAAAKEPALRADLPKIEHLKALQVRGALWLSVDSYVLQLLVLCIQCSRAFFHNWWFRLRRSITDFTRVLPHAGAVGAGAAPQAAADEYFNRGACQGAWGRAAFLQCMQGVALFASHSSVQLAIV